MRDVLKTTLRIVDADEVAEFEAMRVALGMRPHELVKVLVREGIARRRRADPELDHLVAIISEGLREQAAPAAAAGESGRGRKHLRVVE